MTRAVELVLAHANAVRCRLTVPSLSLRAPSRRELAAAVSVLAALALGYLVARVTPLFAVRSIEIVGAPRDVGRDVRRQLAHVEGRSLVAVDAAELARAVARIPSVRSARVDRAFPRTLVVAVEPERPAAVVRAGTATWVVAETGRVVRVADAATRRRLPRVALPVAKPLRPGEILADEDAALALDVLRAVPRRFPAAVRTVRGRRHSVTLVLRPRIELRLGPASQLEEKLAAARAVLASLSRDERADLAYLDVSLPARPVAAANSQVEGET